MIKAIIIDDEKHCIITLQHLIQQHCADVEIAAVTQSSSDAKALIEKFNPDIVFLDIEMPVLNGFDLLNQFAEFSFNVIFTTAYDQYAIQALRLNALDYLLKPIDKTELRNAVDKHVNNELLTTKEQLKHVHQFASNKITDTIALSTQQGLYFVKIDDIMHLEASSCYTNIIMADGSKHLASKTMANFEEVLINNPLFFRAHKSFLVNLKYIKQYIRGEGGEIVMQNGDTISIRKKKKQEFLNLFAKV